MIGISQFESKTSDRSFAWMSMFGKPQGASVVVELLKGHASGNEDPSPVVREQRASPLNNAGRLDNE
jgi:hypothetical protein